MDLSCRKKEVGGCELLLLLLVGVAAEVEEGDDAAAAAAVAPSGEDAEGRRPRFSVV